MRAKIHFWGGTMTKVTISSAIGFTIIKMLLFQLFSKTRCCSKNKITGGVRFFVRKYG